MKKGIVVMCALLGSVCFGATNFDYSQSKEDAEKELNKTKYLGLGGYELPFEKRHLRIYLFNRLQDKNDNKIEGSSYTVWDRQYPGDSTFEQEFYKKHAVNLAVPIKGALDTLKRSSDMNAYLNSIEDYYINNTGLIPSTVLSNLQSDMFPYEKSFNDVSNANNSESGNQKELHAYLYNQLADHLGLDSNDRFSTPDISGLNGTIPNITDEYSLAALDKIENIVPYFYMIEDYYLNSNNAIDVFTDFVKNIKFPDHIDQEELIDILKKETSLINDIKKDNNNPKLKQLINRLLSQHFYDIALPLIPDNDTATAQTIQKLKKEHEYEELVKKLKIKDFVTFNFLDTSTAAAAAIDEERNVFDPVTMLSTNEFIRKDFERMLLTYFYNKLQTYATNKNLPNAQKTIVTSGYDEKEFEKDYPEIVNLINDTIFGQLGTQEKMNYYSNAVYTMYVRKLPKLNIFHDLQILTNINSVTEQENLLSGQNLFKQIIDTVGKQGSSDKEYQDLLKLFNDKNLAEFKNALEGTGGATDFLREQLVDFRNNNSEKDTNTKKDLGVDYDTLRDLNKNSQNPEYYINAAIDRGGKIKSDFIILDELIDKLDVKSTKFDETLQKKILNNPNHLITILLTEMKNENPTNIEQIAQKLINKGLEEWVLFMDPTNKVLANKKKALDDKKKALQDHQNLLSTLKIQPFIIFDFLQDTTAAENAISKMAIADTSKNLLRLLYNALHTGWNDLKLQGGKNIIKFSDQIKASKDFKDAHNGVGVSDFVSGAVLNALKSSNDLADQIKINDYLNGLYQRFANNKLDYDIINDTIILIGPDLLQTHASVLTKPASLIGYGLEQLGNLPANDTRYTDLKNLLSKDNKLKGYLDQLEQINKNTTPLQQQQQQQLLQQQQQMQQQLQQALNSVFEFGKALSDIK